MKTRIVDSPKDLKQLFTLIGFDINGFLINKKFVDMKFYDFITKILETDTEINLKNFDENCDEFLLSQSKEKNTILTLINSILLKDINSRVKQKIDETLDELITNAFFDAKRDNNSQTYLNISRKVNVKSDKPIKVQLAYKDNHVIALVEDPYGTLTKENIYSHLLRTYEENVSDIHKEGAGIGIKQSLDKGVSLAYKIFPNNKTQALAVFKISKSNKEFKEWSNFFITKNVS